MIWLLRRFLTLGLGTIGSIVGIASGVNSLTGGDLFGSGGGGGSASAYVPTGRGQADTAWQDILRTLQGNIGGQASTIGPGINAGYAAMQPGGALSFLPQEWLAMGAALLNQGNQQQANATALENAGLQTYQTSLDPQNALRDKLQQQVVDASRAGTSARGIGMGGEAAGIENQATRDFLINWQNQQLGRQIAGAQALGGAMNAAGSQFRGVGQDYTAGAGLENTAALFPFQAAGAYTGAQAPITQGYGALLQSIIPYLNFANQASQNAFGQQQTGLNNLTTGLSQLGATFNQPSGQLPYGNFTGGYGSYDGTGGGV